MKIYKRDSDPEQAAVKFPYRNRAPARYRVFPVYRYEVDGRNKNTLQEEIAFEEIRHAAEFLLRHRGSAIRMMPGRALVSTGLIIDFDAAEPDATDVPIDADDDLDRGEPA
ncbi:hypothetical protein [Salipiger abyssi]|uniref:hypothetical protein n=1 Tax=Salipiger abyssi TaxID=1250539 RepID=UPI00405984B1